MIKTLHKLEFTIGGYSQGEQTYLLEVNTLHYWQNDIAGFDYKLLDCNVTKILNDSQTSSLVSALNKVNFLKWNKEYQSSTMDGTQWGILITYNSNLKKRVYGSNSFPNGFDEVTKIIHAMLL